ncbi:MAG TPA: hypothetical protein VFM40_09090 [Actinomycetota bacterium]|nr:hypothetical protein [Actinomycetota bacterium]
METFRPRVTNPKVIMVGRRYSLVHRPGSYLINDTKDANAPPELFQVGERSQALRRYRQLEAHPTSARLLAKAQAGTWVRRTGRSGRGTLPRRYGRGVAARRRNVGFPSWGAARMVPERRGRAFVPIVGVLSVGVLIAIMLLAANSFQPETVAPEFSLGADEVAVPAIADGSGDPPRAELDTQVEEVSPPPGAADNTGHRHEAGGGGASVAPESGSSTGSSIGGSDSSTVLSTGSSGSGGTSGSSSGSGGSSSGGSSDSGSADQGGGGSSGGSGSGPGGAGPGGGSTAGGGGTGSGGGGGGGG